MESESNRSWLGAAFGMLFVVVGLFVAYTIAGKMIIGYVSSSSWVEVPATIHDVELVSHHGETTTYSVKSTYSYIVDGVRYKSDRVGLSTGNDNIGSYWEDLASSLRSLQNTNEASALVNLSDPTYSMLDRTFRWKSIIFASVFIALFCGLGVGVTWMSLRGTKTRKVRLQHEQSEGINSNQKTSGWSLAAFGGWFLAVGVGSSLLFLPDAIRKGEYAALVVLLFVFIGLGIIYHALSIVRAFRRFGPTPLTWSSHLVPNS